MGTVVKKKKKAWHSVLELVLGNCKQSRLKKDSIYSLVTYVGSVFVYILNSVAVQESKLHPACFLHTQ